MIRVTDNISIDESELEEVFIRSGGPGGQHVNKVSTAVQLRFDVRGSKLPEDVKTRLLKIGGKRVTDEGVLIISSRASRKRELNRMDATEKLVALIRKAAERPKRRIKTKLSKAKKEKRLGEKKARGGVKRMRRKVKGEE